ncbi:hypothetical protein FA10DRAFT_48643 [Acaromyces ingoldii]|uniref:Uncharacterized protein n=1 Tax=Acaromyces ingoldii TaxID=215250 RepID=A0A316Z0G1_9BASI|nr:hypothetical protein FA10DRAFT_48643 [Acaromyces ingoldii]PWN94418.1 hypothetical protein FA10DRAFT_48643 [Acaromyces ingoldii]
MLLEPLTYLVGLLAVLALLLCIAAGLLGLCNWIEERPSAALVVSRRLTLVVAVLQLLLAALDGLPWAYAALMLLSNALHLLHLHPHRPRHAQAQAPAASVWRAIRAAQFLLPLVAHAVLLAYLRPASVQTHQSLRASSHWPGGRKDWDAYSDDNDDDDDDGHGSAVVKSDAADAAHRRQYTTGQALALMALHWVPTLWALLGYVARTWSLPMASSASSAKSADTRLRYKKSTSIDGE